MPGVTNGSLANRRLWKGGPRLAPFALYIIVAAGLIGSLLLVWDTITSERKEREQAARTTQVMAALRNIDRAALNAETGQRGYFITLDRDHLASYEMGRQLYPRALRRLRDSVRDSGDAEQQELLARIQTHGDARFAELAETVALIGDGRILDAQQIILSNRGMQEMKALRAALSELEAIEQTLLTRATEDASASENRVLPLLAAMLLLIVGALILGFWQSLSAARSEAQAARADELAEARDRADLLAHELNHRVKNLFAVVLAIVRMSARDRPEAKDTVEAIAARINALLEAHQATQGKGQDAAEGESTLKNLIDKVLAPYRSENNPMEIDGPPVILTVREATPIGLVLHELTTNAVKYGAWSQSGGRICVDWTLEHEGEGQKLRLCWREICPEPAPPGERTGFGSMLMQSSARQLNGSIERRFTNEGVVVDICIPHG